MDTVFFFLVVVSLFAGQAGRITVGGGVQFYILEIVVLLHVVWLIFSERERLIELFKSGFKNIPNPYTRPELIGVFWVAFAFIGLVVTSPHYTLFETAKAALYLARVSIFITYAILLGRKALKKARLEKYWRWASIGIPIICLSQYVFLPDLRFLAAFGWDPHMYRAVGLILDPPIAGSLLGIFLMYSLEKRDRAAIICNYLTIIFLYSRSTYLAVLTLVGMYLAFRKKWSIVLWWILFFALSVWIAPKTIPPRMNLESSKIERLSTVVSRKTEVLAGIRAWATSPLWGIGYNRVSSYKARLPAAEEGPQLNHASSAFHSFWVTQLASTGVVGVGILLLGLYAIIRKDRRYAYLLGTPLIIGIFDNVLFHPFVAVALIYATLLIYSPSKSKVSL